VEDLEGGDDLLAGDDLEVFDEAAGEGPTGALVGSMVQPRPSGHDLTLAVEVDGPDLAGTPVGEPEPVVVPLGRLDHCESVQEDGRVVMVRNPSLDAEVYESGYFLAAYASG
jgi:hypothetical protein